MSGATELQVLAWPPGADDEPNPYARLMYSAFRPPAARILAFTPLMRRIPVANIFHLQWPEGIFEGRLGASRIGARLKAMRVLAQARRLRARGGMVALTVHNLAPHARMEPWQQALHRRFHGRLLSEVGLLVGLSTSGLDQFIALHPAAAGAARVVIPHPHYRDAYPKDVNGGEVREMLGLPSAATVLGIVGTIRRSKHVPAAIAAFRKVAHADEALLVAGGCDDEAHWAELTAAAAGDPQVHLHRGRLDDGAMACAIRSVNIILNNQAGTLNSGTALLALSLDRPLIAPDVGAMPELRALVGDNWMQLVPTPLDPTDLRVAVDKLRACRRSRCEALDSLDPEPLSVRLLTTFRESLRPISPA